MNGANKGSLETVVNCLQRENQITIIGHLIPDGDCIGACLGMALALESLGKSVKVVLADPMPTSYSFLAGQHLLTPVDSLVGGGVLLYLDCADQNRTGALSPAFLSQVLAVVNIDHHISNSGYGDYHWVVPTAAAACEICLQVLDTMGFKPSPEVATALYTGMVMDTGSFMYSSTTPQTMIAAARLLEFGANKDLVRQALFETKSWQEVQVLNLVLENIEISSDQRLGWSILSWSELSKIGAADLHFEGMINHVRNIEGIEVAILFREMADKVVKIGFRSRGKYDVNQIAASFGGGGHRLAAGASMDGSLEEVVAKVTSRVKAFII